MVSNLSKIETFNIEARTPRNGGAKVDTLIEVPNPLYGNATVATVIEIGINRALEFFQDKHGKQA